MVAPSLTSRLRLLIANWYASRHLEFLTYLFVFECYLSLSVYIGPEKPRWGVGNYVYVYIGDSHVTLTV